MKLTIDTEEKTISIDGSENIGELVKLLTLWGLNLSEYTINAVPTIVPYRLDNIPWTTPIKPLVNPYTSEPKKPWENPIWYYQETSITSNINK